MILQHIKPHNGGLTIPRDSGQYEYLTTLAGNDVQHATKGNRGDRLKPASTFAGHCGLCIPALWRPQAAELIRVR